MSKIIRMDKPSLPTISCRLLPLKSTLSPLYLLTSFFGHKNCLHSKRFHLGLGLWVTNIIIHFLMDFYEAYAIFGVAWATAIGMFFITFITASSCLAKVTLPWLENSLMTLYDSGLYPETLRIMKIILKVGPVIVICLGCAGGAGQYTCYYMDGATHLDFNNVLPNWLAVVLNVLRFTSLLHIFCGHSLFLVVPVCVIIVSQLSMKEFKGFMDEEFKKANTSMTFGTAVTLFEERVCFIRQSSKSCVMMLIILVISSTLSFTLNAYNFLFVRRLAIYFWFAVLPLLWIAIPLAVAAWATDTYQTFAGVVLKNWAQTSGDAPQTSLQGVVANDVTPEVTCITCRSKTSQRTKNTGSQYARRKFRKNSRNVIRPLQVKPCSQIGNNSVGENMPNGFTLPYGLSRDIKSQPSVHMVEPTVIGQQIGQRAREPAIGDHIGQRTREPAIGKQQVGQRICEPAISEQAIGQLISAPTEEQLTGKRTRSEAFITPCDYPQSIAVRFDFERYIIYLQCLLPDVGFSVGGCLVTWDKVFGLAVFMTSLAAVFIQEVMFGSRKNTIGRP